jgi:hypothetical protein
MPLKNPFKVLGFDPDILKGLSDEEISDLVKSQYKRLQLIYHPDMLKGSNEKSVELTEAYEMLDYSKDPELYKSLKDQFLKRTPQSDKIEELEDRIKKESILRAVVQKDYSETILDYLRCFAGQNEGLTIFNLGQQRFSVYDPIKSINRSGFTDAHGILLKDGDKKRFIPKDMFYDIIIDAEGTVYKAHGEKIVKYPQKKIIGCIDDETVKKNVSIMNIIKKAKYYYTQKDEEDRLVAIKAGIKKSSGAKNIEYYDERIFQEEFAKIAYLLTPRIKEESYLFSINLGDKIFYSMEGKIRKDWTKQDKQG